MKLDFVYEFLFPNGTDPELESKNKKNDTLDFSLCPIWPTDVFGFAAYIIDRSGNLLPRCFNKTQTKNLDKAEKVGMAWQAYFSPPPEVIEAWEAVLKNKDKTIADINNSPDILFNLHFLFRCADAAAKNIGWSNVSENESAFSLIASINSMKEADRNYSINILGKTFIKDLLLKSRNTFCHKIPEDRIVVLPKSITAEVGHTIRSMSHNLALLEGPPKISYDWVNVEREDRLEHFHILFVPYPFEMNAKAIYPIKSQNEKNGGRASYGHFGINQNWLPSQQTDKKKAEDIFESLIKPLHSKAQEHCNTVDCIVLPECAVNEKIADEIANLIKAQNDTLKIRLFITGAISYPQNESELPSNVGYSYFFIENQIIRHGHNKHHRWKLNVQQLRRYGFSGFPADTGTNWWEGIDVSKRRLPFYAISPHSSMAVLICEDLARNDPALPAVRAVGPNLVIALLMDGPQLATRWPGLYASVLADDPGSAVLTVTSAAMVDRSNKLESSKVRSVGLWKHHTGRTEQLILPHDAQGLLLSLGTTAVEQMSMYKVGDGGTTRRFELMGVESLKA